MRKWLTAVGLAAILLTAAALRLTAVDWDEYLHYHPDERYITWVATSIEAPQTWSTALDPQQSTFNPYFWPVEAESAGIVLEQGERRKFAYGHLPLYLGVAATRLAERAGPALADRLPDGWLFTRDILNGADAIEFIHLTAVARALTALVDTATVFVVFWLGRRLVGTAVGLLAAAFLALNVMHIQLAHFFAFDPYVTLFATAAVTLMVVAAQSDGRNRVVVGLLAGLVAGLAVGSKFAAILLVLPLAVLFALDVKRPWSHRAGWYLAALAAGFLAFAVTNPFALLDHSCQVTLSGAGLPTLDIGSCFLENVGAQGAMVQGDRIVPFVRQYIGTTPYLYFVEMQVKWGMGPALGLVAFAGFGWALLWFVREGLAWRRKRPSTGPSPVLAAHLVVFAWTVPFFLVTGGFFVKFMRYLQPLTPFLMVYGAALVLALPWRRWRATTAVLVLVVSGLYALGFVNLYVEPHPWAAASRWLHRHAPEGATIVNEKWDDSLPSSLEVDGERRSRTVYEQVRISFLDGVGVEDDADKLRRNLALLAEGDYLTIASNRVYGVVPRLPDWYPVSSQTYPRLLNGDLGYELVFVADRAPHLAGVRLQAETFDPAGLEPPTVVSDYLRRHPAISLGRADESFTVYDQPLVMIFENSGRMSYQEMLAAFGFDDD